MRKSLFLFAFCIYSGFSYGQYVGIGTPTPGSGLELKGAGLASQMRLTDPISGNSLVLQGGEGGDLKVTGYHYGTFTARPLYLSVDGANTIINPNLGNVGIGTTIPENKLHVFGGSAGAVNGWFQAPLIVEGSTDTYVNILAPDAAATGILFGKPASNISGGIFYNNISGANPNGFEFRTNGNITRMVLTNAGYLGIGTATPSTKLHVVASGGGNAIFGSSIGGGIGVFGGSDDANGIGVYGIGASGVGVYGSSTNGRGMYGISSNFQGGYFYSGNNNGLWSKTGTPNAAGIYAGVFEGNVYTFGLYQGSDKKLKKNIQDVGDALSIINKLKPKNYEFRNDGKYAEMNLPKGNHYGLIAQELEEILPDLVTDAPNGLGATTFKPGIEQKITETEAAVQLNKNSGISDTKAINYTELIPLLIKGMQEQQLIIEEQKLINEKQKIKITILEDRLAKLEAALASITAK